MDQTDKARTILERLQALGVGLSIDDFGTGYASLSYLRNLPFDTLKVDRSFVGDITSDQRDCELVDASIAMAHGLGMQVVAEGVETEEQLIHLRTQGCEYAQGYLFNRAMDLDNMVKLLKAG